MVSRLAIENRREAINGEKESRKQLPWVEILPKQEGQVDSRHTSYPNAKEVTSIRIRYRPTPSHLQAIDLCPDGAGDHFH